MHIAHLIADRTSSDIVVCDVSTPMREALALLARKRIGALPVMRDGRIAGVFSERDVIYCLESEGEQSLSRSVGEVMTAPAISVGPQTTVDEALALMTRRRVRHLPVLQGDTMCGFISIGDLVKSKMDEIAAEAEAMRTYIQMA